MAKIDELLDLPVRAYVTLKRAGIERIEDIDCMEDDELLEIRNFNEKCLQDVREQVKKYKVGKHYKCKYCDYTRGIPYPDEPDFLICGKCGAEWADCRELVPNDLF